jgi:AmiR/NasT family two-component response regulator
MSEQAKAKIHAPKTPEHRAKLSAAAKRQWRENAAFRALVSKTMRRTNEMRKLAGLNDGHH